MTQRQGMLVWKTSVVRHPDKVERSAHLRNFFFVSTMDKLDSIFKAARKVYALISLVVSIGVHRPFSPRESNLAVWGEHTVVMT
jgi:hypothetical protein